MKSHDRSDVLRGVAFHGQARALLRPAVLPRPAAQRVVVAHDAQPPTGREDRSRPQDHPPGYAEGFEQGRQEGRRTGEVEGSAMARAHGEDTLRRAVETQQREADRRQAAATAQQSAVMGRLERLHDDFQTAATARLRALEDDATALAFEAVCRLIGSGAGQGEQLAFGIAEAMHRAREGSILRVRVRPDALPLLAEGGHGRALMQAYSAVEWVADPHIEGEGCILDTDLGSVDARMEIQMERLRRLWSESIGRHAQVQQ